MSSEKKLDSELDSFRREWLSDLQSRTDQLAAAGRRRPNAIPGTTPGKAPVTATAATTRPHQLPVSRRIGPVDEDHDSAYLHGPSFDDLPAYRAPGRDHAAHPVTSAAGASTSSGDKILVSALDHFEEAMIREAQGNMGDSLKLYRQAYKVRLPVPQISEGPCHSRPSLA